MPAHLLVNLPDHPPAHLLVHLLVHLLGHLLVHLLGHLPARLPGRAIYAGPVWSRFAAELGAQRLLGLLVGGFGFENVRAGAMGRPLGFLLERKSGAIGRQVVNA